MTIGLLHFTRKDLLAVLVFDPATAAIRSLSFSAWLRDIGGKAEHDARLADGRLQKIDHVAYDRDGPPRIDRDDLGRRRLTLDFPGLLLIAASPDGVDERVLRDVFEYRDDTEAAWSDLCRFADTITAAQRAIAGR